MPGNHYSHNNLTSKELPNVPSLLSVVTFLHSSLSWCAEAGSDTSDVTVLRGTLDAAAFVKLASMVMEVQYRSATNEMEVPQPTRLPIGSKQIHIPALPPSWANFVSLFNKQIYFHIKDSIKTIFKYNSNIIQAE